MSARPADLPQAPSAALRIGYELASAETLLAQPDVLAVLGFGPAGPALDDPRWLRIGLAPLARPAPLEVWRSSGRGPVRRGRDGELRWACDEQLLFGALEVDEAAAGGIEGAARQAYDRLLAFGTSSGWHAPLRLWNYADAITEGAGELERYRQFNVGRAAGIAGRWRHYPAATAIGRHDGRRVLQVYWLAARAAGSSIENPRQVSAYRYPRQYGVQPPSFARATLPADERLPLLVSGTASVVGHASAHPGDLPRQLDETLRNLDSLIGAARLQRPSLSAQFGPHSVLKVYVREAARLAEVAALLDARLPASVPRLLLHAEICRRELLVEIDCWHR